MRGWLLPLGGLVVAAVGIAGSLGDERFESLALGALILSTVLLAHAALRTTYYRTGTVWPRAFNEPQPLQLSFLWYAKALAAWIDAFRQTYAIEPGLYYTGKEYDRKAPLLVTSNYLLTVFLVVRNTTNVRLLIVDTDGINVWCAAGKGAFGNAAILDQVERFRDQLGNSDEKIKLILPKVGLSGVSLKGLRDHGIRPRIGPVYAKDLPTYLANPPYGDCKEDRVLFGLQSRLFTLLPGLIQSFYLSLLFVCGLFVVELITGIATPLGLVWLTLAIAALYPLLFPWLPGTGFSVKGLWLAALLSTGMGALAAYGVVPYESLIASILFLFAAALFFALSYTGNSAVSNYTRVRAETARFLVPDLALFVASLTVFIVQGGVA